MTFVRSALFVLVSAMLGTSVASAAAQAPSPKLARKVAEPAVVVPVSPAKPSDASPASGSEAESAEKLRQAAQNPVANLISVPFQNNTNFDTGPYNRPQNVLNIQPVIPIKITPEWNLITRWVTPLIYQPRTSPTEGAEFGLGNIQPSFFLSPAQSGKVIWGVGPVFWLPTARY